MEREGARGKVWENVKRIGDQWAGRVEKTQNNEGRTVKVKEVEVIDLT